VFASFAYIWVVTKESAGDAIRRLRVEAGYTLRGFAELVEISAAYQSDIERNRRVPTDDYLRTAASVLNRRIPVAYELLRSLSARIEPDLQQLVERTPEVNQLLREVKQSGRPASEVIKELQEHLRRQREGDG
jgi:transcriptional regulator with XRE-family HTH domain